MTILNFEGIEQIRYETTTKVMTALAEIVGDDKASFDERLKAAKILDGMSDSIFKMYALSEMVNSDESKTKMLSKQLDKLTNKEE